MTPEFEAGVRQAIEWLRADYAYGEGPDWRERGCDWIADRLAEAKRKAVQDDQDAGIAALKRELTKGDGAGRRKLLDRPGSAASY